jgi:hypothetical protein
MPQAVDSKISQFEQIAARLETLESRIEALEKRPTTPPSAASQPAKSVSRSGQEPELSSPWQAFLPIEMTSGAGPVLGKAVLGIAGAFLLRAIAEAGPIPKVPVLLVGIVYAGWWMGWAVKTHGANRFASATYATTSVLILAPLLWECTVRFQVISPAFTVVVLVALIAFVMALSWARQLEVIPWIATFATLITAMALIIATHDLAPLTAAMLAVAAITEISACFKHNLRLRFLPALAANFAVWLLIDVMTSPAGVPEGYPPIRAAAVSILCSALLVIYAGSIAFRSFGLREPISIFEMIQGVFALALATFGILRAYSPASSALGVVFLLLAAGCYWGALSRFAADPYRRNRRVSATVAAALLLAGTVLVFRPTLEVLVLCLAALAAAFLYSYTRKFSLGLHASFYLAAATVLSPLPVFGGNALAGAVPSALSWNIWIVGVAALLCYLVGARVQEERIQRRGLGVVPVALSGFAGAAIAVVEVCRYAGRVALDPSHLAVIRTIVLCVLAVVLGFAGSRWKRVELGWVAYAAVAFGTLKLLLEDLRFGNAGSLVLSLLCYGTVLILLPRLTRQVPTEF